MDRRAFLTLGATGVIGSLYGTRNAGAASAQDAPLGESPLVLTNEARQGAVYLPKQYKEGVRLPILVMLHGLGGSSPGIRYTFPLAEEFGVIIIAPESRDLTWNQEAPGFDEDARYIGAALRAVTGYVGVDRTHVAIGGQSDGATYALGMGLADGNTFSHLMGFSQGIITPVVKEGKPKIFVAHGVDDVQMPIDRTSRKFVPEMKAEGYDVTYREYAGGHGVPLPVVREAFEWFVGKAAPPQ